MSPCWYSTLVMAVKIRVPRPAALKALKNLTSDPAQHASPRFMKTFCPSLLKPESKLTAVTRSRIRRKPMAKWLSKGATSYPAAPQWDGRSDVCDRLLSWFEFRGRAWRCVVAA